MELIRFVNDNLARSNCYIVKCGKKCFVVDPGEEKMTKVIDFLEKNELEMVAVLLTHGHWDHILGINSMNFCLIQKFRFVSGKMWNLKLTKVWTSEP